MSDSVLPDVERNLASPEFRARLLSLLERHGIYRPSRTMLIAYRVDAARRLLDHRMSRSEVRDALQSRFGVSRRTAYRLIERALAYGYGQRRVR